MYSIHDFKGRLVGVTQSPNPALLPDGGVFLVCDSGAEVDPSVVALSQIETLEWHTMLPRVTREFMLKFLETQASESELQGLKAYVKVKALDARIAALRGAL